MRMVGMVKMGVVWWVGWISGVWRAWVVRTGNEGSGREWGVEVWLHWCRWEGRCYRRMGLWCLLWGLLSVLSVVLVDGVVV